MGSIPLSPWLSTLPRRSSMGQYPYAPLHLFVPVLITDGSVTDISTGPSLGIPEDVLEDQEVLELRRRSVANVVFIS